MEGRFDMGGGKGDTEDRKQYDSTVIDLCQPTSVGEQVRRGGWCRSDTPVGVEDVTLPNHKYQGGSADGGHYDVAAERGTPTPTPGTTY
jgi:hypothetical protein